MIEEIHTSEIDSKPVLPEFVSANVEFNRPPSEATFARWNNKFDPIKSQLQKFLENGDLGGFVVSSVEEQGISKKLKLTRSILVTHPSFPDFAFRVGGIGTVTIKDAGTLTIGNIDTSQAISSVSGIADNIYTTFVVLPDGTQSDEKNMQPIGGYLYDSAVKKYDNTVQAGTMLEDSPIDVCEAVAAGKFTHDSSKGELGFFVYALPKDILPISTIYEDNVFSVFVLDGIIQRQAQAEFGKGAYKTTRIPELENGPFIQTIRRAAVGLRHLHEKGYIHRQIHMGQIYAKRGENSDIQQVMLTDWSTLMDVRAYASKPTDQGVIPIKEAIWQDFYHFAMNAITSDSAKNKLLNNLLIRLKPETLLNAIYAYQYPDQFNDVNTPEYRNITQQYGDILAQTLFVDLDLKHSGSKEKRLTAVDAANQFLLDWKQSSQLF